MASETHVIVSGGCHLFSGCGFPAPGYPHDFTYSPLFSIGFALLVVFLFEPLHRRFQGLVDRLFYRQRYDYRKTIRTLSEAMTSILDPDEISRTLIGSVVKEMFLENGALLLQEGGGRGYQVKVVEGMDTRQLPASELQEGTALVGAVKEKKDALLRHDVAMNPLYEQDREELQRAFQSLSSEVVLPMTYKDEVRGILSLGRKKSGKLFTPEDLSVMLRLRSAFNPEGRCSPRKMLPTAGACIEQTRVGRHAAV